MLKTLQQVCTHIIKSLWQHHCVLYWSNWLTVRYVRSFAWQISRQHPVKISFNKPRLILGASCQIASLRWLQWCLKIRYILNWSSMLKALGLLRIQCSKTVHATLIVQIERLSWKSPRRKRGTVLLSPGPGAMQWSWYRSCAYRSDSPLGAALSLTIWLNIQEKVYGSMDPLLGSWTWSSIRSF